MSACVLVFALAWSSRAAGGSDSSCYVLQAEAFAGGVAAQLYAGRLAGQSVAVLTLPGADSTLVDQVEVEVAAAGG